MKTDAIAAVLHEAKGPFTLESIVLDDLRPDELLVRIEACGVCHTDISVQNRIALPAILGHEGVGIVEAIGQQATSVAVGDRVVISYGYCNQCPSCKNNKPYICDHGIQINFGGKRIDGTNTATLNNEEITAAFFQQSSFASHVITPARNTVKVETDIEPYLLAPLACGIMTGAGTILNDFDISPNRSLAIFGVGTVGLSAVMAAKMMNVAPIIAIDVNTARLQLAKELGASHAVDARDHEALKQIMNICPRGIAYSLETSGVGTSLQTAIECLGINGKCAMITTPRNEDVVYEPSKLFLKAATLKGVFLGSAVPKEFAKKIISYYQQGKFPYDKLISTYRFEDINQAIADTMRGEVIKPVLLMS